MSQQLLLSAFLLLFIMPGGYVLYLKFFPSMKEQLSSLKLDLEKQPLEGSEKIVPLSSQIQRAGSRVATTATREGMAPLEERLFRAGFLSENDKLFFRSIQIILPVVLALVAWYETESLSQIWRCAVTGAAAYIGYLLPSMYLDHAIAVRDEEIMYYLPLVIEQFVIGVGSGLDIGPCIHRVVAVAEERDTHNPVTELLRNVLLLTRSGSPLDEALEEIAILAGHTELKHSFMTMGQVSRHGGELTKQLQELANAVASQRETKIESRIKRLELTATGPVVLVFVSFMAILFVGIGMQVSKALGI